MADTIRTRGSSVARLTNKGKRLDVLTPYFETAKCSTSIDPDWFFNYEKPQGKERKSYCNDCPVIAECLNYALNVKVMGIWGGTTLEERNEIRKIKNITPAMLEFGQPDTFGERFHPNARRRNTRND
jgi:WhiB family redox-sensing transcriptional regulator